MMKKYEKGFTLLEVTIALAIISIVFVSLVSLFNTSIGLTDYSKKVAKATFLAQRLMTEVELSGDYDIASGDIVELEDENAGYSYNVKVNESFFPLVKEVHLTVYFESILNQHEVKLTTYVKFELFDDEENNEET